MSRNLGVADFWGFIYVVSRLAIVAAVLYFLYLLRKILVKRGFFYAKNTTNETMRDNLE
ncbi:hypothetical protein OLL18_001609 [Listeria monocytogenes]|nr:hypothetical protein [Listeria monocytogenes]EKA5786499.1 hypothetical protein [Listeria monocytogenes]